jgi:hypothetical protein
VKAKGGAKEGVHQGHTVQHGKPVDVISIGIPREGFYGSVAEPLRRSMVKWVDSLEELGID